MKKTTGNRTAKRNENVSTKYWENEDPIVTETATAEIHYYEKAGKIQMYPVYQKDGESNLGRACVWDNSEIEPDDALALVYGFMRALLDSGIENDAFADAYDILQEAVEGDEEEEDDKSSKKSKQTKQTDEEELDEEFEDDIIDFAPFLNHLELPVVKQIAEKMGLGVDGKKERLVKLLTNVKIDKDELAEVIADITGVDDVSTYDEADEEEEKSTSKNSKSKAEKETKDKGASYIGGKVIYVGGKVERVNKKVPKVYLDWCSDALEWSAYVVEGLEGISKMPTKSASQKKDRDKALDALHTDVYDWCDEWEDKATIAKVKKIVKSLFEGEITADDANAKFIGIIDKMEL